MLPFGTSAGDEMVLLAPGSLDGTSDGSSITCTYFQAQEDTIFVSFKFSRANKAILYVHT